MKDNIKYAVRYEYEDDKTPKHIYFDTISYNEYTAILNWIGKYGECHRIYTIEEFKNQMLYSVCKIDIGAGIRIANGESIEQDIKNWNICIHITKDEFFEMKNFVLKDIRNVLWFFNDIKIHEEHNNLKKEFKIYPSTESWLDFMEYDFIPIKVTPIFDFNI